VALFGLTGNGYIYYKEKNIFEINDGIKEGTTNT
jgi:hypothetical protein